MLIKHDCIIPTFWPDVCNMYLIPNQSCKMNVRQQICTVLDVFLYRNKSECDFIALARDTGCQGRNIQRY